MTGFIQFANHLSPLEEGAASDLMDKLQSRTVNKGNDLLKRGDVCRSLYYIEEGLCKTYFNKEEKEFIMRFFPESSLFTVLDSFLTGKPSQYSIRALEACAITYITKAHLEALCKKHHSIEAFFSKLVSLAAVNMMGRISEMLEENGTERYRHFVLENGALMQRISLGDLANYLGITQVSLSRIRARR